MKGKLTAIVQHPAFPFLWVGILAWLVFFDRLGSTGFLDETEPLFTEAARQMVATGNWITPYFNQMTRFDKPPLIYWLMAIAYHLFGTTEWAARLPSAIAATGLTGFSFYAVRQTLENRWLPYLICAIVALNLQNWFFGRLGYSDMLLSICFGGSLLSFFLGYVQQKTSWYLAFYVLMALGVLTKGPVGVVLPSAIVLIFLFCVGKLSNIFKEMKLLTGILIFLLISIPWYTLAYFQNGSAFIDSFFGVHNVKRFTSVVNQHAGPWYYHILIVLGGCFPWSISLPAAITAVVQQRPWQTRSQQFGLFALIWFSVVLSFFTIALTKYITYTLPLVPAAAILVGLWWNSQTRDSFAVKLTVFASIVSAIALAIASLYSPQLVEDPTMPNLGNAIQQAWLPVIGAVIWAGSAIAGVVLWFWRRLRWFWVVNWVAAIAFITLFVTPAFGVLDVERQLPLRQIAQTIQQVRYPDEAIVMAANFFEKPSLVFYTQQPITFFNRSRFLSPYLKELRQKNVASILLVTTEKTLLEAEVKPKDYKIIQEAGVYQLVRLIVGNKQQ